MSYYDSEKGSIKIPSAEWANLKRRVLDAWNNEQRRLFKKATHVYQNLAPLRFTLRALDDVMSTQFENVTKGNLDHFYIHRVIMRTKGKFSRPLKKFFPLATNKARKFYMGNVGIVFQDDIKTVFWNVPKGDHACANAHDHPAARRLFNDLSRIKWTLGTGGKITFRHAACANEYLKETFGPNRS